MTDNAHQNPVTVFEQMRNRVRSGGSVLLIDLDKAEMEAAQQLVLLDEAQIISNACRPFLVAKYDRFII